MILIISSDIDESTNSVIDWLDHWNINWVRINDTSNITLKNIKSFTHEKGSAAKVSLEVEGKHLNLDDFDAVWYRRGKINLGTSKVPNIEDEGMKFYLDFELKTANDYIYHILEQKRHINQYAKRSVNKLSVLHEAYKCGMNVPESIVTTEKKEVYDFHKKHKLILTKALGEVLIYFVRKIPCSGLSRLVSYEDITKMPDNFTPTLFQKYIEKKYELRTFYLSGKTYTSAIFSQSDEKTKVDFRSYNLETPNRVVPYTLPQHLEAKITRLMNTIGINCGTLDLIYSTDDKIYFLEVNPIGQFGQVSHPCNFKLHKKIANFLAYGKQ